MIPASTPSGTPIRFSAWVLALVMSIVLGGCGKSSLPSLPELVERSSVIFLATPNEGGYRIKRIVRVSPELGHLYVEGNSVDLLLGRSANKPKNGEDILVFIEGVSAKGPDPKNYAQTEVPVERDGTIEFHRKNLTEVLAMIEKSTPATFRP